MQHPIQQGACVVGALPVIFDRERLDLVAPKSMGCLGQGHSLAGAGIEDPHLAGRGGSQGLQRALQGDFVSGEVAVAGEVVRQAREHQSHKASLVCEAQQLREVGKRAQAVA
ncbi:hypothetical protein D3C84_895180 [compost metagenome]